MIIPRFITLLIVCVSIPIFLEAQLHFNDSIPSPDGIDLNQSYPLVKAEFHDYDNDGDDDILGTGIFANRVCALAFFTNNGNSSNPNFNDFTENWTFISSPGNNPYTFGDIDGDGDLDALQAYADSNDSVEVKYLHFLENTNDTSLTFKTPIRGPFNLNSYSSKAILNVLYLEDFDGDEDLDLMISEFRDNEDHFSHSLFYMKNTGDKNNPEFSNPQSIPIDLSLIVPTFADVDGDGDKDLLGVGYNKYRSNDYYIYIENISTTDIPRFEGQTKKPFNLKVIDEEVIKVS